VTTSREGLTSTIRFPIPMHAAGRKLLLERPQFVDAHNRMRFRTDKDTFAVVDSVGAGVGEIVLVCQGCLLASHRI
jgi:microcompartment protein CcmK/EutM